MKIINKTYFIVETITAVTGCDIKYKDIYFVDIKSEKQFLVGVRINFNVEPKLNSKMYWLDDFQIGYLIQDDELTTCL